MTHERLTQRPTGDLRVQLIVNPYSSALTAKRERAIAKTLGTATDLVVTRTQRANHAIELARAACADGVDVVVACGGDGTANEVINGFDPADGTAAARPAFALLPAGGTNVLARALGMPNDPIRAADHLLAALVERREQSVNLAAVDERIFLFAAGVGLDAALIRRMEHKRTRRRPSDLSIVTSFIGIMALDRFGYGPRMDVLVGDSGERMRASMLLVGHSTPHSYLGKVKLDAMPNANMHRGLDIIAPERLSMPLIARFGLDSTGNRRRRFTTDDETQRREDLDRFTVICDDPEPVQVDGEYLGERTHVHFRTIRDAVRLVS